MEEPSIGDFSEFEIITRSYNGKFYLFSYTKMTSCKFKALKKINQIINWRKKLTTKSQFL